MTILVYRRASGFWCIGEHRSAHAPTEHTPAPTPAPDRQTPAPDRPDVCDFSVDDTSMCMHRVHVHSLHSLHAHGIDARRVWLRLDLTGCGRSARAPGRTSHEAPTEGTRSPTTPASRPKATRAMVG